MEISGVENKSDSAPVVRSDFADFALFAFTTDAKFKLLGRVARFQIQRAGPKCPRGQALKVPGNSALWVPFYGHVLFCT